METIFIVLIGFLFGLILTWLFELILKTNKKLRHRYYRHHQILFGYHVHHSTYGLLFIILGVILLFAGQKDPALFIMGLAVGIIFMHTISDDRFVFIEKRRA